MASAGAVRGLQVGLYLVGGQLSRPVHPEGADHIAEGSAAAHVILQIVVLLFRMVGQKCLDRVIVLDAAIGFHIEHTLVLFLKQGPIWRIPVRAEGVQPFDEAPVGLVPGVIVISAGVFGAEFLRQGFPRGSLIALEQQAYLILIGEKPRHRHTYVVIDKQGKSSVEEGGNLTPGHPHLIDRLIPFGAQLYHVVLQLAHHQVHRGLREVHQAPLHLVVHIIAQEVGKGLPPLYGLAGVKGTVPGKPGTYSVEHGAVLLVALPAVVFPAVIGTVEAGFCIVHLQRQKSLPVH